jgi:hypothetical protein
MSEKEEPPLLTPDEETDIYFVFLMDPVALRSANNELINQVTLDEDKINEMANGSAVFIQELRQWMERNQINGVLNVHQFRAMINASSMDYRTYIRTEIGGLSSTSKAFYKTQIQNLPRRVSEPSITTSVASFARENIDGNTPLRIMGRFALPIQVFFTGRNHTPLEVNFLAGSFANPGMIQPKIPVGTQTGPVRVISNGVNLTPFVLTIDEPAVQPVQPAVTRPVIRTGDVVNGRIVPPPRRPGPGPSVPGPELANLSSDDEDEELPEPITTLDQLIRAVFNNIDEDRSGGINEEEIRKFIDILPLEEINYGTPIRRRIDELNIQISNVPPSSGLHREIEQELNNLLDQEQLSATEYLYQFVAQYINANGDLSVAKFKELIEEIANNLYSEGDRNNFAQFLMNYIGYIPPPPVVVRLPSEIIFEAIARGQETITVGQIRDFLIQAGVPVQTVAQIIRATYGPDSEENILSETGFTNRFFDFTQPVQDTLLNYATTGVAAASPASRVTASPASRVTASPASRVTASPASTTASTPASRVTAAPASTTAAPPASRRETKEEKADREMAAIQRNLEEQARRNRQTANTAFNSVIPGLRTEHGKTYKQLYDDSWTDIDPSNNVRMTGVHFAKQRNLQETLEVLRDYYIENSRRLGTERYDADAIKRDLLTWLSSDSEFSTETREENGSVVGPITQRSRERMVNQVMNCVHEQRAQNGTTDDNIHVDSTDLLTLIYTFVKGQPDPKFRSGFAAAWVKAVIEAYLERNDDTREIVDGVTIFTYGDNPNPHVSCAPGTTHRLLPAFNETLSRVFGENPPEMTEAEKQANIKPEQSRKISRWLQLSINEPNATRQSSINFINGKIREERGNPDQWRAIVGDNELTIRQFVEQLYSTLEGGKRRNKRQTKRVKAKATKANGVKPKVTKSKAKTHPLKKRTRKI